MSSSYGHFIGRGAAALASVSGLFLTSASTATAAGFDTPILYTARHQGMGGTAIGYVDDPSAAFHNPAGLSGVDGLGLLGDFSLILADIKARPVDVVDESIDSDKVVAPFFMVAGAYSANDWLTFGLAGFPVASGGAEYSYDLFGSEQVDSTQIVFFEVTPSVSLQLPIGALLPGRLSLGAGYRISLLNFERLRGLPQDPQNLNFSMAGTNLTGVRVGLQYAPIDELSFGVVFRNKIEVNSTADDGIVFDLDGTDVELPFVLPAKLGFGARVDIISGLGIAADAEYAFQSQNQRNDLSGVLGGTRTSVANVFDWEDAWTFRLGVEYQLLDLAGALSIPLRAGYIFDDVVTNKRFPSAFGTPPAPTQSFTLGTGLSLLDWEFNLAAAYRFGSISIEEDEVDSSGECRFCSFSGDYEISALGLYIDFSTELPL